MRSVTGAKPLQVQMNPAVYASLPASACTLGTEGSEGPDRITKLTYNAASELIKTTVAYGTSQQADDETNNYTLNGKLATVTDGENNRTTLEYDGHDRLAKTRYPVTTLGALASSTTDYEQATYDANGNVTQRRLRDGQLINTTYDNLNRATARDVPAPETDLSYTYDLQGRLLSGVQGAQTSGMAYDALGRIVSDTSGGYTTGLQYDTAGRLTRVTHSDGYYAGYVYNTTDLASINENGAATLVSYTYDDLGRRTALTRGNGTVTSYSYDPVSRLASFTQDLTGTVQDLTVGSFMYNPASQITGYSRSNDSYAWMGHYNVNRSYGTNGLNQLTSAGATALGYEGRGNLTSSGPNAYSYTAENRMVTAPGGVAISYDPTGRIQQLTQGANTTKFEHLGPRLIAERNVGGTILRRYVHGPGDDEPVVWYEGASTTDKRWLHTDERGSVVAITNSTGSAFAINAYDEFGIPASTNTGRFQYTGQAWLPEVGLYYYKARMYSPTLGRFMQTDPIGYKDGVNWYDYVDGDPINKTDPSGLECEGEVGDCSDGIVVTGGQKESGQPSCGLFCQFARGLHVIERLITGGDKRTAEQIRKCESGTRIEVSAGPSVTGFLAVVGVSGSAEGSISLPLSSASELNLRGLQSSGSLSITPQVGIGLFYGAGVSGGIAKKSGSGSDGYSPSGNPVIQLGAGDGGGVEVSAGLGNGAGSFGGGVGGGPRAALGAYGSLGYKMSASVTKTLVGCK